jgi:hypothetical protein
MRIIMLSLAAIGAAAVAGAALAQPASPTAGPPPGAHAPPLPGDSFRGHRGLDRGTAPGPRRHHRRPGRGVPLFAYFGFDGYGAPLEPYGDGFFARGGGEVRMQSGRPVYDYDRSYPYQWASGVAPAWAESGPDAREAPRCTLERGVRVCRGRR